MEIFSSTVQSRPIPGLADRDRKCDGRRVKFVLRAFLSFAATLSAALGVTAPADWTSFPLANVALNSNEYYLWPSSTNSPDTITTGGAGTWIRQSGGPPTWDSSGIIPDTFMRSGELFPNTPGGTILVNVSAGSLQAVILDVGSPQVATLVPGINGLRCAYATATISGAVVTYHISFGFQDPDGSEYIGYATKAGTAAWSVRVRPTGTAPVTGTAVYATTSTNGLVYFNYGLTQSASTLAVWTGVYPGTVTNVDGGSYGPIYNYNGIFYYSCLRDRVGFTTDIRAFTPASQSATSVAILPALSGGGPTATRGIRAAAGPDGKIRVAVADAGLGTIYYIKDGLLGKAVTLGAGANADLRGFTFDPNGVPIIVYRKSYTAGFVAYPTEKVDGDGNGRVDLMDTAFNNSSTAGVTAPDPIAAIDGVANSANRFKIQFPV
ncbi:MAG: hypothetical protein JWO82_2897, partial [Akkermansiaceae bacterium]|nr:hypothetical protein [Akkermansiaceae bacterium]